MTSTFLFLLFVALSVLSLYVMLFVFVLLMLIDALRSRKYWWVVIILFLPFVGATAYFFIEKKGDYMKLPKKEA